MIFVAWTCILVAYLQAVMWYGFSACKELGECKSQNIILGNVNGWPLQEKGLMESIQSGVYSLWMFVSSIIYYYWDENCLGDLWLAIQPELLLLSQFWAVLVTKARQCRTKMFPRTNYYELAPQPNYVVPIQTFEHTL